ncbi:MAG: MarR family winged helix-turn-helix transcriptional regulator [Pseudomonadota bacterium]
MDDLFEPDKSCVALNVRRLSRIVTRRYEDALRPVNLKSFQFSALVALSTRDAISHSALANSFGMDLSTLNRNLKPLLARGAIEMTVDPADARIRLVKITTAGKSLYAEALPLWRAAQKETLEKIGPEMWPALKDGMNKLIDRD